MSRHKADDARHSWREYIRCSPNLPPLRGLVQSILNAFHYKGGGEWPDD
jgi:hypothetical protein